MFYLNLTETNTCWRCQNETGIHIYFTRYYSAVGGSMFTLCLFRPHLYKEVSEMFPIHPLLIFFFVSKFNFNFCFYPLYLHVVEVSLHMCRSTVDRPHLMRPHQAKTPLWVFWLFWISNSTVMSRDNQKDILLYSVIWLEVMSNMNFAAFCSGCDETTCKAESQCKSHLCDLSTLQLCRVSVT